MSPRPMDSLPLFHRWTREILAFHLENTAPAVCAVPPAPSRPPHALLERADRLMQASGRSQLLVLGGDPTLVSLLPGLEVPFVVVESRPDRARTLRAAFPDLCLLADTSPQALLLLLTAAGWTTDRTQLILTPDGQGDEILTRLARLLPAVRPVALPTLPPDPFPSLTVAAILHPGEPDLEAFFGQLPPWIRQLVLVWDAPAPPALPALPFSVVSMAHPLTEGFHVQRNLALAQGTGDWILFLDADERLSPEAWAMLPALMASPDVSGWWLPRETLHPDAEHCLIGYGLWPDLQLRLFRRHPALRFEGAIHERLCGQEMLSGDQAVACRLHLRHEQRLGKTREALAAKLARFDALAQPLGAGPRHRLQDDYPTLPRALLHAALGAGPAVLHLPRYSPT